MEHDPEHCDLDGNGRAARGDVEQFGEMRICGVCFVRLRTKLRQGPMKDGDAVSLDDIRNA